MDRSQIVKSSLDSALQQRKLSLVMSNFDRLKLKGDIMLKPLVKDFAATNRYKMFLETIREFSSVEVYQIGQISRFANKLFQTIDLDIKVLGENERVRQSSIINESKILSLDKELQHLKSQLVINGEQLRSLADMLNFTGGVFSAYNKKLNQAKQIYEQTYKTQICTTLDVQTVYDIDVTEEYYFKYQSQLLEVLVRMKKSLESLNSEIQQASNVDFPIKCHNFLINCRSLILELEEFLVDKNCVFNKLLSYVITNHQKSLNDLLDIATSKGKINLTIYSVIEKNFYMFVLFGEEIARIQGQIDTSKREIEAQFSQKKFKEVGRTCRLTSKLIEQSHLDLKDVRRYLTQINEDYMIHLTQGQFNAVMRKLIATKETVSKFDSYVKAISVLGQNNEYIRSKEAELGRQAQIMSSQLLPYGDKVRPFTEQVFNRMFVQIQQRLTQLSHLKTQLQGSKQGYQDNQLVVVYVRNMVTGLRKLQGVYFGIESTLLKLFEEYKKGYQEESQKNIDVADDTLIKCMRFLDDIDPAREADICSWQIVTKESQKKQQDTVSKIHSYLGLIMKAQGKIYQQPGQFEQPLNLARKKETLDQLAKMKLNFEALHRIFDSPVHAGNLSRIVPKFNFSAKQTSNKQIQENKEYLSQIQAYYDQLKQNETKQIKVSLVPNVVQVNKERLRVIEEVTATYGMLFQVYEKLKLNPEPAQLRRGEVPVGDEHVLKYLTLMCISKKQLLNRAKEIKENQNLQESTKKFLGSKIEDVLEMLDPLDKLSMEDLYIYIDLLGKAIGFKVQVQVLINDFIKKAYAPKDQLYRNRLTEVADQMSSLSKDMKRLQTMENKPLGKILYGSLPSEIKKVNEFLMLAQQISLQKQSPQMVLDLPSLKDNKVIQTRAKILKSLQGRD